MEENKHIPIARSNKMAKIELVYKFTYERVFLVILLEVNIDLLKKGSNLFYAF